MGLDAVIYFRAAQGLDQEDLETYLPSGFDMGPAPEHCAEEYPDATHKLDCVCRYYGDGYERGPWPHIAAALMVLFASRGVERVWYGNDGAGPWEIKPGDILRLSEHYMSVGCRPYYEIFEKTLECGSRTSMC